VAKEHRPLSPHKRADHSDCTLADRPLVNDDLAANVRSADKFKALWAPLDLRATVSVPLRREGQLAGIFWVAQQEARHWTAADVELIRLIADRIWLVVERSRVEQALRESEARLRAIIEQLPAGVGVMDATGRWTLSNSRMDQYVPHAIPSALPDRIDRWRFWDQGGKLLAPESWPGQRAMRGETVLPGMEGVYTDDDGRELWVRVSAAPLLSAAGEILGATCVVQDISLIKQAEDTLRRQAALLRAVNDNTSELIFMKDRAGRLTYANAATLHMIGMTEEQAIGSLDRENFRNPAEHEAIAANDRRVAETGEALTVEEIYTCADGQKRVFLTTKSALRDESNQIVGIIGVSRDVTELKEREREREERAAELAVALGKRTEEMRRAEKAEQLLREADRKKDEFLATLAHELRNPLAPIRNAIEIIRQSDRRKEREQAREMMERQVTQMSRLVDDLLDISRIAQGKLKLRKERVDLADVLNAAVESARPLIEASAHELTVTVPAQPVNLEADATRLAQVFQNLLNNAAKYTEMGGHIWLTAAVEDASRANGQTGKASEGMPAPLVGHLVTVSVRDTGIGIAPEHLPRIFEMFSQLAPALERSQGGLGIGLSLVKGLVEMHGGTIEARSAGLGKGSEFTVRLPVVAAAVAAAPEPGEAGKKAGGKKCRILVVDDFRDAADSLAMVLTMCGHETRTAYDGLEAVQTAAIFQPHVVLLDIGLPKMNGYEAARRIRDETWGGKVALVALTGWGQEEDRRRTFEAGFDHHLTKPVAPADLEKLLALLVPQD
jgi:PAS domain S-box-containing protein